MATIALVSVSLFLSSPSLVIHVEVEILIFVLSSLLLLLLPLTLLLRLLSSIILLSLYDDDFNLMPIVWLFSTLIALMYDMMTMPCSESIVPSRNMAAESTGYVIIRSKTPKCIYTIYKSPTLL